MDYCQPQGESHEIPADLSSCSGLQSKKSREQPPQAAFLLGCSLTLHLNKAHVLQRQQSSQHPDWQNSCTPTLHLTPTGVGKTLFTTFAGCHSCDSNRGRLGCLLPLWHTEQHRTAGATASSGFTAKESVPGCFWHWGPGVRRSSRGISVH